MIFAIGFGGYAAAAHSNDMGPCSPVQQSDKACDHHNKDEAQKDSADTDKSICLECMHCCAGHINFYSPQAFIKIPLKSSVLTALPTETSLSSFVFSLLRPPKSIV